MSFPAEAQIAREIHKFAANGLLYRGSKPVMWSVVEKTALAEAEVEYEEHTSDTIYVAFRPKPRAGRVHIASSWEGNDEFAKELDRAKVVIWTTTPWTIPGNRAIAYSDRIEYGLYKVTAADEGNWAKAGDLFVVARKLADEFFKAARVSEFTELHADQSRTLLARRLQTLVYAHPLSSIVGGYDFDVPLLCADHVTEDTGTGFVHTAPGHGREDFDIWMSSARELIARGIETRIPYTVDENGAFTDEAPGFVGKRVLNDKGEKGDANEAVIKALIEAGALIGRGRLKHQYPHSWRSKKPVIFRNTPQWFIAMDHPIGDRPSLRETALRSIGETRWVPASGENRIRGMVGAKPDWVMSRQRAWGVPIAVFVRKGEHEPLVDERVNRRIAEAFEAEGADAWYAEGAAARFLAPDHDPADYEKVDDVLDVWFDSGSTHSYVLEDPIHFPGLSGIRRKIDGGADEVMYLEGSDQHRGWFQSSLLESCGTRGRAPFDVVLTHGFTLDEKGRKMSKSLGNQTFPQDVIKQSGADILRLWVAAVDYSDDQRIGPEILKTVSDNYRKLRNTIRWMLGTLAHYDPSRAVGYSKMEPLDRLMLHKLDELDATVRAAYANFDYARVVARAVGVHERRPLRLLFRCPQGCALLRAALEREAARRIGGDRPYFPSGHDLAGADPRLHRRGNLGRARSGGALGSSRDVSPHSRQMARRGAGREMGDDPARALGGDRRDRDRARGQGDRLVAGGPSDRLCRRSQARRGAEGRRFRRGLHHLRPDGGDARPRRRRAPSLGRYARRRRGRRARAGRQMRALLALFRSCDRRSRISRRHASRRGGAARTRRAAARGRRREGSARWPRSWFSRSTRPRNSPSLARFGERRCRAKSARRRFSISRCAATLAYPSASFARTPRLGVWLLLGFTLAATGAARRLAVAHAVAARRRSGWGRSSAGRSATPATG